MSRLLGTFGAALATICLAIVGLLIYSVPFIAAVVIAWLIIGAFQ